MSTRLPALMDVLDRADAAESLSREALLAAAEDLGTHHTRDALAVAVDAHLARAVPAVEPPPAGVKWRWPRPETPADREAKLAATTHLAWADTDAGIQKCVDRLQAWSMGGIALLGAVGMGGGVRLGGADAAITICVGLLGAALGAFAGGWVGKTWAYKRAESAYFKRQRYLPFTGDLYYQEWVYLDFPETRDYLRALLTSAVPEMLRSDASVLNKLAMQAVRRRRETQAQEAAAARAQRQAEKEAAKPNRLGRFARALNGDDRAIEDEPSELVSRWGDDD